jgi:hypothetical protein
MSSPEDIFDAWEKDFPAADSKEARRAERKAAFAALNDAAGDFFGTWGNMAYIRTTHEGSNRNVLAIYHPGGHMSAVRLLLNDYGHSSHDTTQFAITARRYVAVPGRRLAESDTEEIPEIEDKYEPVFGGFWMYKRDGEPLVRVRHAPGYGISFPQDVPSISPEGLSQRTETAIEMARLFSTLRHGEINPVHYLFEAVPGFYTLGGEA